MLSPHVTDHSGSSQTWGKNGDPVNVCRKQDLHESQCNILRPALTNSGLDQHRHITTHLERIRLAQFVPSDVVPTDGY